MTARLSTEILDGIWANFYSKHHRRTRSLAIPKYKYVTRREREVQKFENWLFTHGGHVVQENGERYIEFLTDEQASFFTEFMELFNRISPGAADDNGPLWAYERATKHRCEYFVRVPPVHTHFDEPFKSEYWDWMKINMKDAVLCFSTGETEEWWGFVNRDDIILWVLRWAK